MLNLDCAAIRLYSHAVLLLVAWSPLGSFNGTYTLLSLLIFSSELLTYHVSPVVVYLVSGDSFLLQVLDERGVQGVGCLGDVGAKLLAALAFGILQLH
jgi:hypothetical protein